MTCIVQICMDEANRQLADYRAQRRANPNSFGYFGPFEDGTPDTGPMPLPVIYQHGSEWRWRVLWGVHKYRWPLSFHYCFGQAADSRGERSDPELMFDIRDLPKAFIGRFNINRDAGCGRNSHRTMLGRAFAADFDLREIREALRYPPAQEADCADEVLTVTHDDLVDDLPF